MRTILLEEVVAVAEASDLCRDLSPRGTSITQPMTPEADYPSMIRRADAREADAIRALVRDAYRRWVARLGREPSPMGDDYARRIADGQAWVFDEKEEIVGLVVLKDGPEALLIPNVAVAPAAQGRGIGRRLLAFAEEEAKQRGYREVRLYVNACMVENVALYRRLGFSEIERVHGEERDRVYVCMAKPVS
jgi:ribosomal protein S18 acetylase RimI-like enzyme